MELQASNQELFSCMLSDSEDDPILISEAEASEEAEEAEMNAYLARLTEKG